MRNNSRRHPTIVRGKFFRDSVPPATKLLYVSTPFALFAPPPLLPLPGLPLPPFDRTIAQQMPLVSENKSQNNHGVPRPAAHGGGPAQQLRLARGPHDRVRPALRALPRRVQPPREDSPPPGRPRFAAAVAAAAAAAAAGGGGEHRTVVVPRRQTRDGEAGQGADADAGAVAAAAGSGQGRRGQDAPAGGNVAAAARLLCAAAAAAAAASSTIGEPARSRLVPRSCLPVHLGGRRRSLLFLRFFAAVLAARTLAYGGGGGGGGIIAPPAPPARDSSSAPPLLPELVGAARVHGPALRQE